MPATIIELKSVRDSAFAILTQRNVDYNNCFANIERLRSIVVNNPKGACQWKWFFPTGASYGKNVKWNMGWMPSSLPCPKDIKHCWGHCACEGGGYSDLTDGANWAKDICEPGRAEMYKEMRRIDELLFLQQKEAQFSFNDADKNYTDALNIIKDTTAQNLQEAVDTSLKQEAPRTYYGYFLMIFIVFLIIFIILKK